MSRTQHNLLFYGALLLLMNVAYWFLTTGATGPGLQWLYNPDGPPWWGYLILNVFMIAGFAAGEAKN